MPKEIDGVLKYRKSELLEYYIKFYSKEELEKVLKTSKVFENKDLNFYIEKKFVKLDVLIAYCEERNVRIAELQAIIDSLTGVPGQEKALAQAEQNLTNYIKAEPYEFTLTLKLNTYFKVDKTQILPSGEIPLKEITKLSGTQFTRCTIGPDATFEMQDLSGVVFQECILKGSNLFDSCDLYKVQFRSSKLSNINFDLVKDPRKEPLEKEDKYLRYKTPEISKSDIKTALKQGENIPYVVVEQKQNIQVR